MLDYFKITLETAIIYYLVLFSNRLAIDISAVTKHLNIYAHCYKNQVFDGLKIDPNGFFNIDY